MGSASSRVERDIGNGDDTSSGGDGICGSSDEYDDKSRPKLGSLLLLLTPRPRTAPLVLSASSREELLLSAYLHLSISRIITGRILSGFSSSSPLDPTRIGLSNINRLIDSAVGETSSRCGCSSLEDISLQVA
ncbi:hypothetical protein Tco_0053293 [Tanacetum coccineum]